MSVKISINAIDVWGYFQKFKIELKSYMHTIACNPDYGIEVSVTEKAGLPSIVVTADDTQIYEETAVSQHDCEKTVEKIYDEYLTDKVLNILMGDFDDEELTYPEVEDMITEREEELDFAIYDFAMTVLQNTYCEISGTNFDIILDDLKEHFLEYMARKHGIPIYRPMFLEYEDGTEAVSEYPYEDMEFNDEDNPIYKK